MGKSRTFASTILPETELLSRAQVGADKAYKKTSTSKKASNSFSVKYGTGTVEGTTYTDEVGSPGLTRLRGDGRRCLLI
jgi:hypothetical protein